jgi:hypothetical protein
MHDGAGADGSGCVVADGGVQRGLDFSYFAGELVDEWLADDPIEVGEEEAGFAGDGGVTVAGLELAFFADEAGPGFEDGEDGDDVAGVSGDGALVAECYDVEADGGWGVDPLAFDLVAVVDGGPGLVEVGEECVGDDDVVDAVAEPAVVVSADERAGKGFSRVAVGE